MAFVSLKEKTLCQGATYTDQISITDEEGAAIDLTGAGDDYEALFEIRSAPADEPSSTALVSLTELDGVVLADGVLTITLSDTQTTSIVSSTTKNVLWAELDLRNTTENEVSTFQWRLNVVREYAREVA